MILPGFHIIIIFILLLVSLLLCLSDVDSCSIGIITSSSLSEISAAGRKVLYTTIDQRNAFILTNWNKIKCKGYFHHPTNIRSSLVQQRNGIQLQQQKDSEYKHEYEREHYTEPQIGHTKVDVTDNNRILAIVAFGQTHVNNNINDPVGSTDSLRNKTRKRQILQQHTSKDTDKGRDTRYSYITESNRRLARNTVNNINFDEYNRIGAKDLQLQVQLQQQQNNVYDLTSPREWLEYSNCGVYTVVRCELFLNNATTTTEQQQQQKLEEYNNEAVQVTHQNSWKLWGLPFHIQRLCNSYNTIFPQHSTNVNNNDNSNGYDENNANTRNKNVFLQEMNRTVAMIQEILRLSVTTLLSEDERNQYKMRSICRENDYTTKSIVFMLTILWSPSSSQKTFTVYDLANSTGNNNSRMNNMQSPINIQCHICRSSVPSILISSTPNDPNSSVMNGIVKSKTSAIVATPTSYHPNRYCNNPQAKYSSWCTIRRPIEEMILPTFRNNYNDSTEIILTMPYTANTDTSTANGCDQVNADAILNINKTFDKVILLEGLTSNIFFVYQPGNIIRTSQFVSNINGNKDNSGTVLQGYGQTIVIDAAKQLGYTVDCGTTFTHEQKHNQQILSPISMNDAPMWSEVFSTSSIKIMTPLSTIYQPEYKSNVTTADKINGCTDIRTTHPATIDMTNEEILSHHNKNTKMPLHVPVCTGFVPVWSFQEQQQQKTQENGCSNTHGREVGHVFQAIYNYIHSIDEGFLRYSQNLDDSIASITSDLMHVGNESVFVCTQHVSLNE